MLISAFPDPAARFPPLSTFQISGQRAHISSSRFHVSTFPVRAAPRRMESSGQGQLVPAASPWGTRRPPFRPGGTGGVLGSSESLAGTQRTAARRVAFSPWVTSRRPGVPLFSSLSLLRASPRRAPSLQGYGGGNARVATCHRSARPDRVISVWIVALSPFHFCPLLLCIAMFGAKT